MKVFPPRPGPLLAGLFLAVAPASASEIDISEIISLPAGDVIVLGEIHHNPAHHLNQATAIAALRPAALVFEMFGPDAALAATPEIRASPARLEEALGWADSGWPDFAMYYPIFVAAPDAAIFGGDIPRDQVRRAVLDGAAAVMGASAPVFGLHKPLGVDEQAAREDIQRTAHCDALPDEMLPGMVEAQRLRDAGLARAVLAALAETDGPVVVITGNGHARNDWGMPRMLNQARPDVEITTIAQFEEPRETAPFDHWIVTHTIARDDPCLAFQSRD
ncbi:MAG: ChaN family lipoprotein [Pseudomonadota bacterium]